MNDNRLDTFGVRLLYVFVCLLSWYVSRMRPFLEDLATSTRANWKVTENTLCGCRRRKLLRWSLIRWVSYPSPLYSPPAEDYPGCVQCTPLFIDCGPKRFPRNWTFLYTVIENVSLKNRVQRRLEAMISVWTRTSNLLSSSTAF